MERRVDNAGSCKYYLNPAIPENEAIIFLFQLYSCLFHFQNNIRQFPILIFFQNIEAEQFLNMSYSLCYIHNQDLGERFFFKLNSC